jgi:hypothetical protein
MVNTRGVPNPDSDSGFGGFGLYFRIRIRPNLFPSAESESTCIHMYCQPLFRIDTVYCIGSIGVRVIVYLSASASAHAHTGYLRAWLCVLAEAFSSCKYQMARTNAMRAMTSAPAHCMIQKGQVFRCGCRWEAICEMGLGREKRYTHTLQAMRHTRTINRGRGGRR